MGETKRLGNYNRKCNFLARLIRKIKKKMSIIEGLETFSRMN